MKKSFHHATACVLALSIIAMLSSAVCAAAAKPAAPATLENIMKSFNGESNANARYLAFAKKADEEGFAQVASLFRAAAAAEEIHFKAQAEVITKLGGTPKADILPADVKSTKENLEAALKGESYERDAMYPEFIKVAEKENIDAAIEVFTEAKAAETAHAALYKDALDNLDAWKSSKKDFFVCPECGNTLLAISFEKCPVCAMPKAKFLKIS